MLNFGHVNSTEDDWQVAGGGSILNEVNIDTMRDISTNQLCAYSIF